MNAAPDMLPPLPPSPAPVAAPSFVLPGNIVENVRFLAGRVEEVALCFFENAACLAYTEQDLPPDLRDLPLRWHVHLPFDLPWPEKASAAACRPALDDVQRLLEKIARLELRFQENGKIQGRKRNRDAFLRKLRHRILVLIKFL